MALTLQQMRDYIYTHLELDVDDVPATLLDTWAAEGFLRVLKVIRRWPFYQQRIEFSTVASQQSYTRAASLQDLRTISAIWGPDGLMEFGAYQDLEQQFFRTGTSTTAEGRPCYWADWADTFYLYPTPNAVWTIVVLGYREPVMFGSDVGAEPDMPEQFHQLIRSWMLYRAHLHQDDQDLGEIEKIQFTEMLDLFVSEETRDDGARPMIYGGSRKRYSLSRDLRADYSTWT